MARLAVVLGCLLSLMPAVVAAQAPSGDIGVQASFNLPLPSLQQPAEARAPWLGAPMVSPTQAGQRWQQQLDGRLAQQRIEWASTRRMAALYGANNLTVQLSESNQAERKTLLGIPSKYADLSIDGSAFLEIRTDRLKNLRCTPAQLLDQNSGCRGGFKAPRLDNEFNAKVGGVIGSRLHLNVDYDSRREFNANNDIQVFYEGLQDEILQRVEIGTVSFRTPPSRFLTAAIPANNFGLNATLEFGAFTLQGMVATQEGSVVGQRTYTVGATTSEPQDRLIRDLDFESGRFFWAVDPVTLPNYPFVDILNLDAVAIPPTIQPADAQVRVYRYRTGVGSGLNPNLGGISAIGFRPDGPERVDGTWQLLLQGTDYYLDPSAIWFALATKLDQNDYLAVSYVTVDGTRVGTFPAVDNPAGRRTACCSWPSPCRAPRSRPSGTKCGTCTACPAPTSNKNSLRVSVSLNQSERPSSTDAQTYLAFFGLAIPPDPHIFDVDNRLFPRLRDPGADLVLRESYIAYPTLQPFVDPRLQPNERADSVYTSPVYLLLTPQGPPSRFQMRLQYDAAGGTDAGSLNLNALQVRRGSEQLIAGGRVLERGVDYEINYDLGQVTFSNPAALFPSGSGTVTARFEERGIFAVAPTSIFGGTLGYSLGDIGSINLVGMYQKEQSVFTRPSLGFEPTSNLLTGITTDLRFEPNGVTRFFDRLSTQAVSAPSRLDIRAEYGVTNPDPNILGQAYLEDFEGESFIPVSMSTARWAYGSVPQSAVGVEPLGFAGGFDSTWAVQMSWQNLIPACNGCPPVELLPQDIDPTIITNGQGSVNETVLYLTFQADTAGGMVQTNSASLWSQPDRPLTPRWRSLVTPLSQSGIDLSRAEYLEFWVFQGGEKTADSAGVQLVIDLGSVDEDALAVTPDSLTVTGSDSLYTGRHYDGVGVLNSERQSTGIFNASTDDIGILLDRIDSLNVNGTFEPDIQTCTDVLSETVAIYPWGDLGSRCTVGNGFLDTEDLNGDNRLNAQGSNDNVLRWVVTPNELSQYYVRTGATFTNDQGLTSTWTLYRIPMRLPAESIGTPNLRLIQSMRVTFVAPATPEPDVVARFALARARFIGAPWVRRSDTPLIGISGSVASPTGTMFAAVISTEDVALGYISPPGRDQRAGPQRQRPAGEGPADQREVAPRRGHLARRRRTRRGLPALPLRCAEPAQVRAGPGLVPRQRRRLDQPGPDGLLQDRERRPELLHVQRAGQQRELGARGADQHPDLAPAPGRHRAAVAAGPPAGRCGALRHRRPAGLRGVPGALCGPGGGPRGEPAEPGLRAGIVRRHLPPGQHADARHGRALGGRHPARRPGDRPGRLDGARRPAAGGRRGGFLGELRAAGRALPTDRAGPHLPDHRRHRAGHQYPGRPVPAGVAGPRHSVLRHLHPDQHRPDPGRGHRHPRRGHRQPPAAVRHHHAVQLRPAPDPARHHHPGTWPPRSAHRLRVDPHRPGADRAFHGDQFVVGVQCELRADPAAHGAQAGVRRGGGPAAALDGPERGLRRHPDHPARRLPDEHPIPEPADPVRKRLHGVPRAGDPPRRRGPQAGGVAHPALAQRGGDHLATHRDAHPGGRRRQHAGPPRLRRHHLHRAADGRLAEDIPRAGRRGGARPHRIHRHQPHAQAHLLAPAAGTSPPAGSYSRGASRAAPRSRNSATAARTSCPRRTTTSVPENSASPSTRPAGSSSS